VAANLLRLATEALHIWLIDRSPPVGRGVAYGTDCPDHLLNVPAARMGAYPDDPEGFYKWVAVRVGRAGFPAAVAPGDYLPRYLYGEYIYFVLNEAREKALREVTLEVIVGEAIDIEENSNGAAVLLVDGRSFGARRVVLALGNLPGEYPIRRSMRFFHGPHYAHVPWASDALVGIRRDDDVLLVGAGLTAADTVTKLTREGHRGKIHALSRRGIRPQVHQPGLAPYHDFLTGEVLPSTARQALRRVRKEIRVAAAQGVDWRAVIDALRPHTGAIWQAWSWEERSRFLRHARPHWEAYRHRLPPQTGSQLDVLSQQGRLLFYGGRLQSLTDTPSGAEAVFRRRGSEEEVMLNVAKVINCTGPRSDYSKYQHPLFINLLARGLIDHDPLALGINSTPAGELFRYRGEPSGWFLAIGSPLKGVLWECTAVAEIRVQARTLAAKLLSC
jgi:uncharacterized NAD(P)/FAD-binding protein YdhS